jgi:hypothetical protein
MVLVSRSPHINQVSLEEATTTEETGEFPPTIMDAVSSKPTLCDTFLAATIFWMTNLKLRIPSILAIWK